MKQPRLFKDTLNGFTAQSMSKSGAWMLIRNRCHELKKEVPTLDKIIEVTVHNEGDK